MRPFIVAIDGPAGAGKSPSPSCWRGGSGSVLVDTGAIYRCVALSARRRASPSTTTRRSGRCSARIHIHFKATGEENRVFLDGEDVSAEIRTPDISLGWPARCPPGRWCARGSSALQRRLALEAPVGAILEGRDIGTVVFPDADLKFFLEASPDVRARRRYEELFQKGSESTLDAVLSDQIKRDRDDASRAVAPLKPAEDAVRVDSSGVPLSEVVQRLERVIRERLTARAGA